jgi:hypothetical protein
MKIQYNRGTLHLLPPRDAGWWTWCDVVDRDGTGDGVEPTAAHAVRGLLEYDRSRGEWRTTCRLESYLRDKHGIELVGDAGLRQSKLPKVADGGTEGESSPRTIGAGTPDTSVRPEPKLVQVDLNGDRIENRLTEQAAENHIDLNEASGHRYCDAGEKAEMDTRQATLDRYMRRVRISALVKPAGDTYGTGTARVVVE